MHIVRARDIAQSEQLALAVAADVVPEVVEGSLQLGGSLLRQLGESWENVEQVLEEFWRATYSRLGEIIVGRSGTPGVLPCDLGAQLPARRPLLPVMVSTWP